MYIYVYILRERITDQVWGLEVRGGMFRKHCGRG